MAFLRQAITELNRGYGQGKPVGVRPDWRYILIRRKSKGHGHIAVYAIQGDVVYVLHVFHSAQDWQTKLVGEDTNR